MIPFDKLYTWLFKSFNISSETELIQRLVDDGYQEIMIIKRSWIFALLMLWMPLVILILSAISIWIAYDSIDIVAIKYTLITGNILMSMILIISSITYIIHFQKVHSASPIVTDTAALMSNLEQWDRYFRSFFNWSITNQLILVVIIILEIVMIFAYWDKIGDHFWILTVDTFVILLEIFYLRLFRKRMMDLEMDYNIVVLGKIFFVNQSGVLSAVQTIESDKIKTVQSTFPNKIASFFNYGTIAILTEGDSQNMGTMNMYYVTDPDGVVSSIQSLLDEKKEGRKSIPQTKKVIETTEAKTEVQVSVDNKWSKRHSLDTREKIRDVLR